MSTTDHPYTRLRTLVGCDCFQSKTGKILLGDVVSIAGLRAYDGGEVPGNPSIGVAVSFDYSDDSVDVYYSHEAEPSNTRSRYFKAEELTVLHRLGTPLPPAAAAIPAAGTPSRTPQPLTGTLPEEWVRLRVLPQPSTAHIYPCKPEHKFQAGDIVDLSGATAPNVGNKNWTTGRVNATAHDDDGRTYHCTYFRPDGSKNEWWFNEEGMVLLHRDGQPALTTQPAPTPEEVALWARLRAHPTPELFRSVRPIPPDGTFQFNDIVDLSAATAPGVTRKFPVGAIKGHDAHTGRWYCAVQRSSGNTDIYFFNPEGIALRHRETTPAQVPLTDAELAALLVPA